MSRIRVVLDSAMCMLWIMTYTLVLIGTIKYRYPMIAPITQAIIAPFEFSVLFLFHKLGLIELSYATLAYLYWAIIEVAIFRVIEKLRYIKEEHIKPYIIVSLGVTFIMIYFVTIKEKCSFLAILTLLWVLLYGHNLYGKIKTIQ